VTNRSTFLARKLNKEAHKKNHARHAGKEETEAVSGIANVAKNINDLPSETSTLLLQKILSSQSFKNWETFSQSCMLISCLEKSWCCLHVDEV
jgi:hypothetical protein